MVRSETWPRAMVRFPVDGFLLFIAMLWVPYFILVVAVTIAISIFGTVTTSVWDPATQIIRWFAFGIGAWMVYVYLPVYIAHGATRRNYATTALGFTIAFSVTLASFTTIGFVLERIIYGIGDWPQKLSSDGLFSSPSDLPVIFVAFLMAYGLWTVTGTLLGAAFYRFGGGGLMAVVPGLLLIGIADLAVDSGVPLFGFVLRAAEVLLSGLADAPAPATIALCIAGYLLGAAITWLVLRDVPVRSDGA